MKRLSSVRSLSLVCLLGTLGLISGCSSNFATPDTVVDDQSDFGPVQGTVYGGHAPLVGAHLYVLTTGSGAIGAQAGSLLGSGSTLSPGGYTLTANPLIGGDPHIPVGWYYVTTDANGGFNITNGYKCTKNTPVYLYAYGGNPTANVPAPPGSNPAVVNLATLGICPFNGTFTGSNITYVYMNEVSTVATAYAFQGFTSPLSNDAIHIGYNGTNSSTEGLAGIQNATYNTLQLYDIRGSVLGHNANYKSYAGSTANSGAGTVPQATLDTVANILAACVDSSNITSPPTAGTPCAILFATATNDGTTTGIRPTDTATAAINIARHPAGVGYAAGSPGSSYAATLNGIPTGTVPFSPNLGVAAPPDFTIGIQFPSSSTTPALSGEPQSIATDSVGNFWFTTQVTAPNPPTTNGTGYLAEGSPLGVITHSAYNGSYTDGNIAIDSVTSLTNGGNAWVSSLTGIQADVWEDGPTTGYAFTPYGVGFTRAAAPVADNSTSTGTLYMVHGPTNPTCPTPPGSCNDDNPTLTSVTSSGGTGNSYNLTPLLSASAYVTHAAIDSGNYIWLTSDTPNYGNTIVRVLKTTEGLIQGGTVPAGSGFPVNSSSPPIGLCGSGWYAPEQPAIDALGNGWIPVYGFSGAGTGVFEINPAGTNCNYFPTGNGPYGAAVDGVSNVWITNQTDGTLTGLNYTNGVSLTSTATITGPNFQPQNAGVNLLNDPMNLAVDISGDVFITNFNGNSIVEMIGLTTPVYGPLGVAAGAGKIGATP
jgi:hypothetical protein